MKSSASTKGTPEHPVTQALLPTIRSRNLPLAWLEEIVDGKEMDLDQQRYQDYRSLLLYCHRAAGVVGQAAAEIFGYHNRQTLKYAHELGLALAPAEEVLLVLDPELLHLASRKFRSSSMSAPSWDFRSCIGGRRAALSVRRRAPILRRCRAWRS